MGNGHEGVQFYLDSGESQKIKIWTWPDCFNAKLKQIRAIPESRTYKNDKIKYTTHKVAELAQPEKRNWIRFLNCSRTEI